MISFIDDDDNNNYLFDYKPKTAIGLFNIINKIQLELKKTLIKLKDMI